MTTERAHPPPRTPAPGAACRSRRGAGFRRHAPACLVLAVAGACALADEGAAPGPAAPGAAAATRPLATPEAPPVESRSLPDLSHLSDAVQRQVRERDARVAQTLADGAAATARGRAYGELGLILSAAGLEDAGLPRLIEAERLDPSDPRWSYYLGYLSFESGDFAQAATYFERARELRPADVPTLVWLGRMYLVEGRPGDALPLFRTALATEPDSAAILTWMGRAALERGDHARAVEHLQRALEIEPRATRLHYSLALAYRGLGETARAEAHMRRRGQGEPAIFDPLVQEYYWLLESAQTYHERAAAALTAGDYDAAVTLLRRGLALEPGNPALGYLLGAVLYRKGDVDAAIAQLEDHVRRLPDHVDAQYMLGMMHGERQEFRQAIPRLSAALRHDPDHVDAHLGLAEIYQVTGRLEESFRHWDRVTAIEPGFADAWIEGADVLVRLRRYEEAARRMAAARRRHPDHERIRRLHEALAGP